MEVETNTTTLENWQHLLKLEIFTPMTQNSTLSTHLTEMCTYVP